jgi:hypothetical protein
MAAINKEIERLDVLKRSIELLDICEKELIDLENNLNAMNIEAAVNNYCTLVSQSVLTLDLSLVFTEGYFFKSRCKCKVIAKSATH